MLSLLVLLASAPALEIPEQTCEDGRRFYAYWTGEYPLPVVQVKKPAPVLVSDSPCEPATRVCTMPKGLYHPWSKVNPPEVAFGTRAAPQRFVAGADFTHGDLGPVTKGSEVVVRTYIAEGICSVSWGGKTDLQMMCPGNDDSPWKPIPSSAPPEDQILRVACDGDKPGWLLVDEYLMVRPDFVEGDVVGYGDVRAR